MSARFLIGAALLALATPAMAQDLAVTGATVALGDGSDPIENATVVIRGGQVVAAGTGVAVPAGVQAVDGRGMWVTPGLFASITDLGLVDVDAVSDSNDIGANNSPYSAALDVAPAINPQAQDFSYSRAGGVTRASVTPSAGSSIFAGQGALVDLSDDYDAVMQARSFQLVEMGERGASLAGGSRTSVYAMLHNALAEAAAYRQSGTWDDSGMLNRLDTIALVPVLTGEQKLYVRVHRAADILSVLALRDEYPALDMVLLGVTEGWMVADRIAAAGVPVITVALNDLPASFERLAATQSNVGRMVDAGVMVGIGGYESSADHPRNLPQQAGNMVALNNVTGATGLTWGEAFAAITSVPARIAGMDDAGVLAPGAHGDLVIWDGDPLEVSSAPLRVFIDGVEQPLDNHQTRLRDRYRSLDESQLPRGYER